MEYAGGTHVSQVNASSPKSACVKWARDMDVSQVEGLGLKSKQSLIDQMESESPVALEGMSNAWCATAFMRGELALINFVRTEQ
jgi:hypothetical protein